MTPRRMQRAIERGSDAGLTLIEVVVALTLLGVVAAAALTFFVRGMQSASHLQRNQAAVTVASQAMEKVHAVYPRLTGDAPAVNGLILGRTQTAVNASFAAAKATDVAEMTGAYDTAAATRPGGAVLPITYTTKVSNATYTVTTLIGTCFRPKAASASDQNCTKADPGLSAQLFRVTVVVSWLPGKATECKGSSCEYRVSTLVDPTVDANWNLTAKPVAYDDESSTVTGSVGDVSNTLANDVYGFITAGVNPTTITQNTSFGTAVAITTGTEIGRIKYTPPTNASGKTTIKYRLKDGAGRTSNEATVTYSVRPKASAQSLSMETNATGSWALPVIGTGMTATITGGTGGAAATVSGTTLNYTSTSSPGTVTVKYKVKDSSGLESDEATMTIVVSVPAKPVSQDKEFVFNASPSATTYPIDIVTALGLSPKSAYILTLSSGSATPSNGGSPSLNAAKTDIIWTISSSQLNQVGVFTFKYTIKKGVSAASDEKTITVKIKPIAQPITAASGFTSGQPAKALTLPSGVVPTSFTGMTFVPTAPVCTIGGGATVTAPNVAVATGSATGMTFKAPTWNNGDKTGTCTFSYTMTWTNGALTVSSDPAAVSITVNRP